MESLLNALPWIVGGLVLVAVLAALRKPLQWLVRVLARTGVGLAVLWCLSGVGGVLGVLGAPGFGLLLLMNWALAV